MRKDYLLGPLHFIVREDNISPQFGMLLWGGEYERYPTLDIWLGKRLLTVRKNTWKDGER